MDFVKILGQEQWKSDRIGEQGNIFQINSIACLTFPVMSWLKYSIAIQVQAAQGTAAMPSVHGCRRSVRRAVLSLSFSWSCRCWYHCWTRWWSRRCWGFTTSSSCRSRHTRSDYTSCTSPSTISSSPLPTTWPAWPRHWRSLPSSKASISRSPIFTPVIHILHRSLRGLSWYSYWIVINKHF